MLLWGDRKSNQFSQRQLVQLNAARAEAEPEVLYQYKWYDTMPEANVIHYEPRQGTFLLNNDPDDFEFVGYIQAYRSTVKWCYRYKPTGEIIYYGGPMLKATT